MELNFINGRAIIKNGLGAECKDIAEVKELFYSEL